MNKHMLAGIVSAALLLPIVPSMAAPATVVTNVNVRSGPGFGFPVNDILLTGDLVEVDRCDHGWCFVRYEGIGWIDQALLQAAHPVQRYGFHRNASPHVGPIAPAYGIEGSMPRPMGHDGQEYGVRDRPTSSSSAW